MHTYYQEKWLRGGLDDFKTFKNGQKLYHASFINGIVKMILQPGNSFLLRTFPSFQVSGECQAI